MNITVRQEVPSDIPAIDAVIVAAFSHAPHTEHNEQFIAETLRRAGALSVSLVAEQAGAVVGHVAASPVRMADGGSGWYGIGPISVLPASQSQGLGTQLMQAVLRQLKALGAAGCVVLGDPGYYARFGFKALPQLVYPGVPPEYFQALSFGARIPDGAVIYHAAFDARA